MGRFRLESYSGRSMESGPDGFDGIIGSSIYGITRYQYDEEKLRQILDGVPTDNDEDFLVPERVADKNDIDENYNNSMTMSEMAKEVTRGMDIPTTRDLQEADDMLFDEREDEYERFIKEVRGYEEI